MSNRDKPLVLGFIPVRAALVIVYVIGVVWVISVALDLAGIVPDPPETINIAFMAILSPLAGGLMSARKDQGPPAEVRAVEQAEREQQGGQHE